MSKEAMKQQILEVLSKKLGAGFHISIQKTFKTNQELDGLVIMQDGKNTAPTIYMEPFYEALRVGTSIDNVTDRIIRTYYFSSFHMGPFDIQALLDFDYVKDKLYVQLINRHSNQKLLQNIPHSLFLEDFAVTIRCLIDASEECAASFLVSNNHLDMWQKDFENLLSHTLQNTRKMLGVEVMKINELIQRIYPEMAMSDLPDTPMWVMTNKRKMSGAATALFNDVLKDFAEKHGNFYVIFSSVHEILLVPTPDNSDIDVFTKMNQEVNATQVEESEVLGTKTYYYCKGRGFVL